MEYTKEAIEKMKNDPLILILCTLIDRDVDDVIAEAEETFEGEGKLDWDREKGTIKIPKPKSTVATPKESMVTPKFPIKKEEYDFLVKCVIALNRNILTAQTLGLSIDTKNFSLLGAPITMIYTLLRTFVDPGFAGKFVAGIPNENADYFYRLYDEQTGI